MILNGINMEKWKPLDWINESYLISNYGRLKRLGSDKILKPVCRRMYNQYGIYSLCNKRQPKHIQAHRLVAMAFIPNPYNKPQVNHIDGNKLNNHFTNLEWCTGSENIKHAIRTGLLNIRKGSDSNFSKQTGENNLRSRKVKDIFTGQAFNTIKEAAEYIGVKPTTLVNNLSGHRTNNTNLRYA
jgi:hypothetical protein